MSYQGYYPPQQNVYQTTQYATVNTPQSWWGYFLNQITPQQLGIIRAWFDSVDRNRSGSISAMELAMANFGGRPLGFELSNKFIKVFDKDRSGTIEFNEYLGLHQFLTVMTNAFIMGDRDRSGYLDPTEIFTALMAGGFQLSLPTVQALVAKFDRARTGMITYETFLLMTAHLAHVRSIFEWNDPSRTGRVTYNYDQLTLVTTDVLL
jgi:Ca2+-binding EF-hand superfamily protein